jgi:hypothetical protein
MQKHRSITEFMNWPSRMRLITLREITMMQLMNQLTEKQDWDRKVRAV